MKVSAAGIAEIMLHEGIVPFRYRDSVGVDTFGVGHTAAAGPPDPRKMAFAEEHPMTEVVEVFRRDLAKFDKRVDKAVTVSLRQHERDSLVSFDVNTGRVHNATLTKKLNAGDRAGAIAEFDKWHIPPEVKGRRQKEQALFAKGNYSSGGFANVYPANASGSVLFAKGKRINVMPAIAGIVSANESDAKADADRNKGITAGTGGAASGAGTQAVPQDAPEPVPTSPDLPDLPTDGATLRLFLIAGAVILIGVAVVFFIRSANRRKEARAKSDGAAMLITAELATAPRAEGNPK